MLLYRISPNYPMEWADSPFSSQDTDLAGHLDERLELDWQLANNEPDETTIRLALRYGYAQASYLVYGGDIVVHHRRTIDLAASQQQIATTVTNLPVDIADSIAESTAQNIAESGELIAQAIASKDPDPLLVLHWEQLGGYLPKPI